MRALEGRFSAIQSTCFPNGTAKVDIILIKQTFFRLFLKKFGIVVVKLLQDVRNDDIAHESGAVAHRKLLAVLVDQREFPLVEKDDLAAGADQPGTFLAPESRSEVVLLRFLFTGHTYIIVIEMGYSMGSPSGLHHVACRSE